MMTVDLLLTLGGQVAGILNRLLDKNSSKPERQQIEEIIQQYTQIKTMHKQIELLLQKYNQGIQELMAGRKESLFPLCTYQGYQHIEKLYSELLNNQINVQRMGEFKILSVTLLEQKLEEVDFISSNLSNSSRSEVYTYERWTTHFTTGQHRTDDVVNFYQLLKENGDWKVDDNRVFIRRNQ